MKHLFFDLDRTLWDFERNSEAALHELFHSLELDQNIPDFSVFHELYKEKNAELWKLYGKGKLSKEELRSLRFEVTLSAFGLNDTTLAHELSMGYIELSPRQTQLHTGALETLSILKKEGYQMHIITNGFKEVQYIKLENSGLAPYFEVVVCSEEIGKNKPSPDIFNYSINKAGARRDQSVMIGDDPEIDIVGALNAGLKGVLFDPEDKYRLPESAYKVKNLAEIPELLPWVFKP
jgi:putative hydrolase of the HAD superfamily